MMKDRMDALSFVILSWNSQQYLSRCFDSIIFKCREEQIPFEILAVDNGSTDNSVAIVQEYCLQFPENFSLTQFPVNRGTTMPRNIALKQARGSTICVLDSDTEFKCGGIRPILQLLEERKDIGIVAPRLLLKNGKIQHSVKKFPTFVAKLLKTPNVLGKLPAINFDFYSDFPFNEKRYVDTAISACWFFRRELLEKVGYFDEKIFYSPEDLDFCLRVGRSGYKIIYYPTVELLHHTQHITHRAPYSKNSMSHLRGLFYYYLKHGGWIFPPRLERKSGR